MKSAPVPPPAETIDLHGMTQQQAHQTALQAVEKSIQRHARELRIITGKGTALRPGVLREMLPRWLDASAFAAQIASITIAPREKGGQGVYIVRFKRQREKKS